VFEQVLSSSQQEGRSVEGEQVMQPELACTVSEEEFGTVGYLVIHNRVHGRSCGGVRLVPDISLEEMRSAARTMAYKSGFIGFPMGGAKAAIQIDGSREPYKEEILFAFGKVLSPLIRSGAYMPGIDMNSTVNDIQVIRRGAGIQRDLSGWNNITHEYTAWSCFIATLVALEARGHGPQNVTFAVQGFGKVGSEYAKLMSQVGAKLIAVSNRSGAIGNDNGFDISALIRKRHEEGEEFITHYPGADRITHEQVLGSPATVFLPAARAWAIHEENYHDVQAEIIVCAANVAMEDSIEHRLFEDGKIVIPDFVANCGGLFGSVLEHEVKTEVIWNLLDTAYRKKISHLLSLSSRRGEPIYAIAGKESEERMASWSERERSWPEKIRRWLWAKAPEGIRVRRHVAFYEQLWRT